jgi:hypothetical protein
VTNCGKIAPATQFDHVIELVGARRVQQFVPSIAIGSGEVIVTIGGLFDGGGGGGMTMTLTGSDFVESPTLSVATAVRIFVPIGALLHVMMK